MNNFSQYGHVWVSQSPSDAADPGSLGFQVSLLAIEMMTGSELYELLFGIINRLEALDARTYTGSMNQPDALVSVSPQISNSSDSLGDQGHSSHG